MEKKRLYKTKIDAKLFGVCKGFSEYSGVPAFVFRASFIVLGLFAVVFGVMIGAYVAQPVMYLTMISGFLLYSIIALLLPPKYYKYKRRRDFDSLKEFLRYRVSRISFKSILLSILSYGWLILMGVIVLTPVLWMVSAAFTDTTQLTAVPIYPDFSQWSLANYIGKDPTNQGLFIYKSQSDAVLPEYIEAFFTTFKIAALNTVLVVVFSSLVGFAFSRYNFKGKKKVLLTLMGLQMFPSFMGMLALMMFFRQFGLTNNWVALTMIYVAGSIPYNTFIVRGFMRNIPKSLDEAASIDGATNLQVMWKIIIPLAVPIMGFIAVTAFMGPWLDYILPSVIMPQEETVAVWLFRYMNPLGATYSPVKFMAGALFLAVPIMVVQAYMQRYMVYGLTTGAEKG
jgi:arabinogalactan oligomer/maltooligosaccharide transport system permease protein